MTERQTKLLKIIIENYINFADPIGSKFLAENGDLEVSAPTLRNEMRALEESGFLVQPHTSAGRIPTEKGYKFYIEHLMEPEEKILNVENVELQEDENPKEKIKNLAKFLAEYTGNAVFVAFGDNYIFYTGISNLFSQPEFRYRGNIVDLSQMFDKAETLMYNLQDQVEKGSIKTFVGSENPFGNECGSVVYNSKKDFILSNIGPMRMNYSKSFSAINFVSKFL